MNAETLSARAATLWSDRRLRLAAALVGFAAVTVVSALVAHPVMFGGFAQYDDEGYMLTALKGYVEHGHLYDQVFSQYGPFYFEFWGGIFSLFGIPVTHDAGRTATMVAWIVSSLGFGLSAWRITRSACLGIGVQVLTFGVLGVLHNEPMHPYGMIALLLAGIVCVAAFVAERESPLAMALLGALLAALLLVKINIGFFVAVSLALVFVISYRPLRLRWLRLLVELGFVALPFLLMAGKIGEGWVRHYAIHVAVSALAVVIVLRARRPVERRIGELRWFVGGAVILAALSCLTIVATGTSLHGLVEGTIVQPLRQSDAFDIPTILSRRLYAFDVVALAVAVAYWFVARQRDGALGSAWLAFASLFAIGVGVTMALSVTGQVLPFDANTLTGYPLAMLPFAWVALMATTPGEESNPTFAYLFVPVLAIPQALHAYPVAGSQLVMSVVLLIPVGGLCVANGVRGLACLTAAGPERVALGGLGVVGVVVVGWFVVNSNLREPLKIQRANYDAGFSLGLPGASDVRVGSEEEVAIYQAIARGMREYCTATLMEPGMDSFYLWAEQEPPSLTATSWETLFDDAKQERVIADTESIDDLCLLRNKGLEAGWGKGDGPLVRYLEHGFEPVGHAGEYELLLRKGPADREP